MMFCRNVTWLICMIYAVFLATVHSDLDSAKEWSRTRPLREVNQMTAEDLGDLLDARDGATVTLVGGDAQLVAHRAVLAARSPVLAAMLRHYGMEASGDQLIIPDIEGPVLRQVVAYLYTLRAPRLPSMAPQLLAAAERFGLPGLKADCQQQVAEHLSVETAAAVAVLAAKHSFNDLRDAAIDFIKDHFVEVLATKGWGDAVVNHPKEVVELTRLLAGRLAEGSAVVTTEAMATPTTQPHSDRRDHRWTAPTAAPPTAPKSTPTTAASAVSRLPSLSKDDKGWRLIETAEDGAVEELQSLLDAGADVGTKDEGGSTALHWAAYRGHVEAVRRLLDAGSDANAWDNWQSSPLHVAAWSGRTAVVRLLTASAADPNARDKVGRTPLHLAVLRGHTGVVTALLEAGADREATDENGNTPLDIARKINRQQLIDILSMPVTTDAGTSTTTEAGPTATTESETTSTTQLHSDPDHTPVTAALPHEACPTSPLDEATVSRLRSLSWDEKNKRLRQAAWEGRVEELRSLLAAGADVHARDQHLWTTMDWATKGPVEVVSCLLAAGSKVDTRDSSQYTPLHWAVRYGHVPVVRLIAASSANINTRDKWGYTPLHWAAWNGNAEVATTLLEMGADKWVKDNAGATPLDVAKSMGHLPVQNILTQS